MNYNLDDYCEDYQEDVAATVEHNMDPEGEYQWLEPSGWGE